MAEAGPGARRGRPKSPAKHEAILAAARMLFMREPYERVSLDSVAEAAGVSKVTIYSHFPDKDALFVEAINSSCAGVFERVELDPHDSGRLEEKLLGLGCDFLAMIFDPEIDRLHTVILSEGQRRPELPQMFYDTVVRRNTAMVAAFLQQQVDAGHLRIADAYTAAVQFLAIVQGEFRYRVELGIPNATPDERESYVRGCVDTLLRAWRA